MDTINETRSRRGRRVSPLPKRTYTLSIPVTPEHLDLLWSEAVAAGFSDLAPYLRQVKLLEPPLEQMSPTREAIPA